MNTFDFKRELISISLKALNKPFDEWITFNDTLNTNIIEGDYQNAKIKFQENELPILECCLDNTYLLVTTERIVSVLNNLTDEVFIDFIEGFSYEDDFVNYKKVDNRYPKVNKITVVKKNGECMSFFVDSYYPFYFVNILIRNLLSYKKYKKWFISPK